MRPKGILCLDWEEASPGKRACKHLQDGFFCQLETRFVCEEAERRGLTTRAAAPSTLSALRSPPGAAAPPLAGPAPATAPQAREATPAASVPVPGAPSSPEGTGGHPGEPLPLWERTPPRAVLSLVQAEEDSPEKRILRGLLGYEDPPDVWTSPPRREERQGDVLHWFGKSLLHLPRHWPPAIPRKKKAKDGALHGQADLRPEDDGGEGHHRLEMVDVTESDENHEEDWRTTPHLVRSREEVEVFCELARAARAEYVELRRKEPTTSEKAIQSYWTKHLFLRYQLRWNDRRMDSAYFPDVLFRGAQYYWSIPTSPRRGRWDVYDVFKTKVILKIVPGDMLHFQV